MNGEEMMKVKVINDYMSLVDFGNVDNIDPKKIEYELSLALNERPAVKLQYEDDIMVSEGGKKDTRISNLKTIDIYYTYEDAGILKFGKKSYTIA